MRCSSARVSFFFPLSPFIFYPCLSACKQVTDCVLWPEEGHGRAKRGNITLILWAFISKIPNSTEKTILEQKPNRSRILEILYLLPSFPIRLLRDTNHQREVCGSWRRSLQSVVRGEDVAKTLRGDGCLGHTDRITANCPTCGIRATKHKGGTKLRDV